VRDLDPPTAAAGARAERIGLLGGTFDPPHAGHVGAARACLDALTLDRVLLVVANHPWQKSPHRAISAAETRLALVRAAVEGMPGVEVSRIEIDRGGPSYTIDTAEALRRDAAAAGRPPPELFLIVGADLVETLPSWHRVHELADLVTLVIVARPGSPAPAPPDGWRSEVVGGPGVDVSSSLVRTMVAEGRPIAGLVPEPVVRCILRRGLYAVGR
jgi:nicotinate-nucleotide adenylyltransferase